MGPSCAARVRDEIGEDLVADSALASLESVLRLLGAWREAPQPGGP